MGSTVAMLPGRNFGICGRKAEGGEKGKKRKKKKRENRRKKEEK